MRGHLVQRHKGSWSLVVDVGREVDPATGLSKRKQKWVTFHGTKKEAEKALSKIVHDFYCGQFVAPSKSYYLNGAIKRGRPVLRAESQLTFLDVIRAATPAEYLTISSEELRRLRGPLVYVFISQGGIKYVGMSKVGLGRALASSHHILKNVTITASDSLAYFPMATVGDAEMLEARLIKLLHPEWNNGGGCTPERRAIRVDAMRRLGVAISSITKRIDGESTSMEP